ncbi:MAG: hypothetical protein EP318_09130 [Rhodobacteraceae bacterium]|nr:MAG: hypothetical protein EP318_09130 [Paracoccaceae bacterium]
MIELFKPLKDQIRAALQKRGAGTRGVAMSGARASPSEGMAALGRPLREHTPERIACEALFRQGRDLARQEAWPCLAALLAQKDRAGATTAAGTPEAEVLAAGARSDLGRALEGASQAGALAPRNEMLEGLAALEESLAECDGDPHCAALVALAHMDAGWAWYKQGWLRDRPEQHIGRFRAAFARAQAILAPFPPEEYASPLLASARCALLAGRADAEGQVIAEYDRLIRLAPHMPGHMRAFGLHLLPCWFGSHALLDLQARRIAGMTAQSWGAGAYAWVYLDALLLDPGCFRALDAGFFLEALDDILTRVPGQHMTNLLAAYLSRMLAGPGPDRALRRALTARRDRLIRHEMTETHAWVWSIADTAYATPGTAHLPAEGSADSGMQQAWAAISAVLTGERRGPAGTPRPAG